jgi:hypothetical protein
LGLKTPESDDDIFIKLHEGVKNFLTTVLPDDVQVITFDMEKLVEDIWGQAIHCQTRIRDSFVISSCIEVASSRRGQTIEINRIVDINGHTIGYGPRPGYPSVNIQMQAIAMRSGGNPVILAEDGAFTGGTINFMVKCAKDSGVEIAAIVVGLCFPEALETIRKFFDGEVIVVEEVGKPYEWMPDHDFIPFAPNCGRVFGGIFGNEALPHYSHDGLSFSLPYVLPFGDPVEWASIPQDSAREFSLFCLHQSLGLFRELEKINGKRILLKDLAGSTPRVSIPLSKGYSYLPGSDLAVTDFLSDACHELS